MMNWFAAQRLIDTRRLEDEAQAGAMRRGREARRRAALPGPVLTLIHGGGRSSRPAGLNQTGRRAG